ncbi:MAG: hypothetical protein QOJ29_2334 [Thermoleophilaceae bacterium]|jgi:hypothetical protein|nr:hypothetical protein [Thermoleophilaceae bacterium]
MPLRAQLLDLASRASPVVCDNLDRYGDSTVLELLADVRHSHGDSLQPRDDLFDAVYEQAVPHYGPQLARQAVDELRADPVIPTSNHYGIDTFADSVQGTVLFALRPTATGTRRRTVVVLGGATVSLNNLTYPMGLLLYDHGEDAVATLPRRVAILPRRGRRATVRSAPPIDAAMVRRAGDRLHAMRRTGALSAFGEQAAGAVLEELTPDTLSVPSYGHQATRINTQLWRRLFHGGVPIADVLQLELEATATALIDRDLSDSSSLLHQLLFTGRLRDALLAALDGARACWCLDGLQQRLGASLDDATSRDGTVFFWGLNEDGRRVPLTLLRRGTDLILAGIDERRRAYSCIFHPEELRAALHTGVLVPSLFTCYVALAFARGLVCVGGYYQVAYLPVMQRAIVDVLHAENPRGAVLISQVPTDICLAGLQFCGRILPGVGAIPAGPVEIGGAGGLTGEDLDAVRALSVPEAHLASFAETLPHMAGGASLPQDWSARLAADNAGGSRGIVRLRGESRQ